MGQPRAWRSHLASERKDIAMALKQQWKMVSAIALAIALTGCGGAGGGGGGLVLSPRPPAPAPTPAPTPSAVVEIFQAPATQEFAAVTGGPGDPMRVRYDAATAQYQVMAPGRGWDALVDNPHYEAPSGHPDPYFAYALSSGADASFFHVVASYRAPDPALVYQYSNLAVWGVGAGAYWDNGQYTAFGIATPPGGVPVSGTGSYQGLIAGSSTVEETDNLIGGTVAATVSGTVALRFDFGSGSLAGEMHPYLNPFGGPVDLGTLAFADTVFSVGSQTYSGRFDTAVSGSNAFSGLFTGPSAQELIGEWAFPFVYPVDGSVQSASGAWIAKRN